MYIDVSTCLNSTSGWFMGDVTTHHDSSCGRLRNLWLPVGGGETGTIVVSVSRVQVGWGGVPNFRTTVKTPERSKCSTLWRQFKPEPNTVLQTIDKRWDLWAQQAGGAGWSAHPFQSPEIFGQQRLDGTGGTGTPLGCSCFLRARSRFQPIK